MLNWRSGKGDGATPPKAITLSAPVGAAGLVIEASHRDDKYTEVEADSATRTIMWLFQKDNAAARTIREEAEAARLNGVTPARFAEAAKSLETTEKEALITRLWALCAYADHEEAEAVSFISSIADVFGIPHVRARALRPTPVQAPAEEKRASS